MDACTGELLAPCAYELCSILPKDFSFLPCAWEQVWELLRDCLGEQAGDPRGADLCPRARELRIECFYISVSSVSSGSRIEVHQGWIHWPQSWSLLGIESTIKIPCLQGQCSFHCVSPMEIFLQRGKHWEECEKNRSMCRAWEMITVRVYSESSFVFTPPHCALLQAHGWQSLASHCGATGSQLESPADWHVDFRMLSSYQHSKRCLATAQWGTSICCPCLSLSSFSIVWAPGSLWLHQDPFKCKETANSSQSLS